MLKSAVRILIFGGTGTLGHALVEDLHSSADIMVFSRDEYKQSVMRSLYPDVRMVLGDVRDRIAVRNVLATYDPGTVILASAMKRIEMCESQPSQAVMTNVLGAVNVVEEAVYHGVENLVAVSTDKAVEPVNVYGMTKAIQERIVTQAGYNCVRYGNVFGSRGSVVPLFLEQAKAGKPLTVTDPAMTRFILTKNEAVSLVRFAMDAGERSSIFVARASSATVGDIAMAISPYQIVTGRGTGEKLHEVLISSEEVARTTYVTKKYCRIRVSEAAKTSCCEYSFVGSDGYNSCDNDRLGVAYIKGLLEDLCATRVN